MSQRNVRGWSPALVITSARPDLRWVSREGTARRARGSWKTGLNTWQTAGALLLIELIFEVNKEAVVITKVDWGYVLYEVNVLW